MKKALLTTISLIVFSGVSLAEPAHHHDQHHGHHHKAGAGHTTEQMAQECEERRSRVEKAGGILPEPWKTEFEYNLEITAIEIKTLKNPNLRDSKKHVVSCHSHLNVAEHIVRRHDQQIAHEKRMEERKAKESERKAKADERRTKRAAAKASRAAAKAERAAENPKQGLSKDSQTDNGRLEGASKEAPGTEAKKHLSEEKK